MSNCVYAAMITAVTQWCRCALSLLNESEASAYELVGVEEAQVGGTTRAYPLFDVHSLLPAPPRRLPLRPFLLKPTLLRKLMYIPVTTDILMLI